MPKTDASRNDAGNDNKFDVHNRSLLSDMVMGLRFYSRYPIPGVPHEPPELNRMAPALGFTGVVLGIVPAIVLIVLALLGVPSIVSAGFAVAAYVVITGTMAEDALADSADGLFGGNSIVTRLAILQDSRHGTYGVTALVLFLLLRVGALAGAITVSPFVAACLWLGATLLARSGALWLPFALSPARQAGNSATAGRLGLIPFAAGLGISILLAGLLAAPFVGLWGIILALIVGSVIAFGWKILCKHFVGGQTGDLIGALQALLEIVVLTIFVGIAS